MFWKGTILKMKPSWPKNKRTLTFYRYSMRRELKSKIESITKDVRLALIAQNLCPQGIFVTERTKTFIAGLATLESMELQAIEVRLSYTFHFLHEVDWKPFLIILTFLLELRTYYRSWLWRMDRRGFGGNFATTSK